MQQSERWLIPTHVHQHWVLLEVRWDLCQFHFYDSMPDCDSAKRDAELVEMKAWLFLQVLRDWLGCPIDVESWEWVVEQVCKPTPLSPSICVAYKLFPQQCMRQTNWFDCGPFVCANVTSLSEFRTLSVKTEDDMVEWWHTILQELRMLAVRVKSYSGLHSDTEVNEIEDD